MATIELWGRINQNGKLEVELPSGLPEGEVKIRLDVPEDNILQEGNLSSQWTDEEIYEAQNITPMTPAELVLWLDANPPSETWGELNNNEDGHLQS